LLLYGERDYHPGLHADYDLIFMPSWLLPRVEAVDLFVNKNSLGEMRAETARAYLQHVNRAARFFFHLNHDRLPNRYEGGEVGLLGHEYPVDPQRFRRLIRYPDLGHLLHEGPTSDIVFYLYERRD
jgi:hypothetical protein